MSDRVKVWMVRHKRTGYWQLRWNDPVRLRTLQKSTGTEDEGEAKRQLVLLEEAINDGRYGVNSPMTWAAFREEYETKVASAMRPKSREKVGTVFDAFERICKPQKLRQINERTISTFVYGLRSRRLPGGKVGSSPFTVRSYLVCLKTAIRWAADQKLLTEMPKFPKIRVPKKRPQPVPEEWFGKMLAAAPSQLWRAYLMCGWWGGLRLSEARHLRRERNDRLPWLDLEGNRIVLPAEFAKADEDQWVPLHPDLRRELEALPDTGGEVFPFRSRKGGGPLTRNGVTMRVRLIAKKAGVKLSMHKLRKGFGCRVAKQLGKGNAPVLHRLMRHSSMQVTMEYYASVDDALQDAIKELK